jgi:hypothetical protein
VDPVALIHWAASVGPATAELVRIILESKPHPEMGYRACLGIMGLAKTYTAARLEAASQRALLLHAHSYRDKTGRRRLESTNTTDWDEVQRQMRERLAARDNNTLDLIRKGKGMTFDEGRTLSWRTIPSRRFAKRERMKPMRTR